MAEVPPATCPACRRQGDPSWEFCRWCGARLHRAAAAAPIFPPYSTPGPACPQCGRTQRPGERFCGGCGRRNESPVATSPQAPTQPQSSLRGSPPPPVPPPPRPSASRPAPGGPPAAPAASLESPATGRGRRIVLLSLAGLLALVAGTAGGLAITGRSLPFIAGATSTSEATERTSTSAVGDDTARSPSTTSIASSTTTSLAPPTETVEQVAAEMASIGWYVPPSYAVATSVLADAVSAVADYGETLGIAVLATEPAGGATGFADGLVGGTGNSIVLVIGPDTAGWAGRPTWYNTDQVDAALDTALALAPSGEEFISAFVDALTEEQPPLTSTTLIEDLGLETPMSMPECDGSYVVFFGYALEPERWVEDMTALLASEPGSNYLRTDVNGCSSLRPRDGLGRIIYAAYLGPYESYDEACEVWGGFPEDVEIYVKRLDNVTDPADTLRC